MLDVLPVRYELNMMALEKYMPDIYNFSKIMYPNVHFDFLY